MAVKTIRNLIVLSKVLGTAYNKNVLCATLFRILLTKGCICILSSKMCMNSPVCSKSNEMCKDVILEYVPTVDLWLVLDLS
jgi:hypothetical protein